MPVTFPFTAANAGGGITNAAGANVLTISDGTNIVGSSLAVPMLVNGALTQTLAIPPGVVGGTNGEINLMTLSGANHLTATGDIFAYVVRNAVTFDTTGGGNASGGYFAQVTSARVAGAAALQNKGFEANILGGDSNIAFHSLRGDILQDVITDSAQLGNTSTNGLKNLTGIVDLLGSSQVKLGTAISGTIGNPGTATVTAELKLGVTGAGTSGLGVHVQNTVPGIAFTGIEVGGNTTVEPSVRPSVLLWRGPTGIGSGAEGGLGIASGAGFPFSGIVANDMGVFLEGGGDLYLGADNTTFVAALKIKSADNSVRTLNGPLGSVSYVQIGGLTGPKWSSGAGSPAGVVVGSPGDLYSNTTGGAVITLYVKESGAATTAGWIAK